MRNTQHKFFHDRSLKYLHNDLDKGMTFDGTQAPIEKVLAAQKNERNHPTYRIRLNERWYRFALHREIKGEVTQVQVTRAPPRRRVYYAH